jgi:hypothetical protein
MDLRRCSTRLSNSLNPSPIACKCVCHRLLSTSRKSNRQATAAAAVQAAAQAGGGPGESSQPSTAGAAAAVRDEPIEAIIADVLNANKSQLQRPVSVPAPTPHTTHADECCLCCFACVERILDFRLYAIPLAATQQMGCCMLHAAQLSCPVLHQAQHPPYRAAHYRASAVVFACTLK